MHDVMRAIWGLVHNMLWVSNVASLVDYTPELVSTFLESGAQYQHYLAKYLTIPFPSPSTPLAAYPSLRAAKVTTASMNLKQYDHGDIHHFIPQALAHPCYSLAECGSS